MTTLQVYDPFADAGIDQLFRGFFRPVRDTRDTAAAIKVDVTEKPDAYVVNAEIPGVKKEDIKVSIDGNQISIGAEVKKETEEKKGETVIRSERYYGNQFRAFTLPQDIDQSKAEAQYEDGLLNLTLPKKEPGTVKQVTVK